MTVLLVESQPIHDNPDFFDATANIYAAIRDRVEEVIVRGNFKWLLLILLVLLAVWYVRWQRLSSLAIAIRIPPSRSLCPYRLTSSNSEAQVAW